MTPTNEERMNAIVTRMPLVVLQDVEKRITDWLSHGGSYDDPYIEQQIRYMENIAHRIETANTK